MAHGRLTLWRIFILGRSVVTGTFLLLLLLMNGLIPPAALYPLYLLAVAQFATNGFYLYLWRRRDIRFLGFLAFGLEIVLISLLIFLLGADGYVFVLAYLWPIIMGGWLIGRRAIPPLTLLGIMGYALLVFLAQRDWMAPPPLLLPTGIPQTLVLCLPYLAFVSLLVWLLTREMERSERHLQARNRDLHRVNFGLRYLVSAGEELQGCPDVGDMATLALRKVAKLTGHTRGVVSLREGATLTRCVQNGFPPGIDPLEASAGVPAEWLRPEGVGRTRAIHTVPLPPAEAQRLTGAGRTGPGAVTHVALRSGCGLEGVLSIVSSEVAPFDAGEEQILQVFGHQVGVALENASLLANLQYERNLLGSILARMADGVLVVSAGGGVLLANAAAHTLLGVREGETLPDWLGRQMEGEGNGSGRHMVALDDRVVGVSTAELVAGAGVPRATIYVARDVTQEAQLERAKSDFVAYVSHELRTPLTTIKMLVRLLLMDAPEVSQQREYLSVINTQVTRQTRMVSNLLDFTRLEAGKYDLPIEEVDPRAVVQTAANVCRPLAEDKGLALAVECPPEVPPIMANAGGLEQVLVNLLSNAVKFTEPGGRVTARCCVEPDTLRLIVEDTGIGMSPEQMGRIFVKFYTVRNPHKRGEGTGLGLVISRMIVQALGGTIEVESREKVGSRFTVRLPRDRATETSSDPATPVERGPAAVGMRGG